MFISVIDLRILNVICLSPHQSWSRAIVKTIFYRAFDVPDDDDAFERVTSELMPEGESRVWNNAM